MGEASHPGPPKHVDHLAFSSEVLDDLEAVLTRIDSASSDDEPLVASAARGQFQSQGVPASTRAVRGRFDSQGASTVPASMGAIRGRFETPPAFAAQCSGVSGALANRDRLDSQVLAPSAIWMGQNRFEILGEVNDQEDSRC